MLGQARSAEEVAAVCPHSLLHGIQADGTDVIFVVLVQRNHGPTSPAPPLGRLQARESQVRGLSGADLEQERVDSDLDFRSTLDQRGQSLGCKKHNLAGISETVQCFLNLKLVFISHMT